jgi:hypothetical protein
MAVFETGDARHSAGGEMAETLHITSGDSAGASLVRAGLPGEVFVWHDILYDEPRCPGWPDEDTLNARAAFLEEGTPIWDSYDHLLQYYSEDGPIHYTINAQAENIHNVSLYPSFDF